MGEKSGSGMNILDHFFESLETVFGLKIVKFFDAYPDLLNPGSEIRYKHPGPATLLMTQWEHLNTCHAYSVSGRTARGYRTWKMAFT
jgi:hypothetical protein